MVAIPPLLTTPAVRRQPQVVNVAEPGRTGTFRRFQAHSWNGRHHTGRVRHAGGETFVVLDEMEARMLLGTAAGATAVEIHAAFRRRVRSFHPDHGGPGADMDAFVAAKHVLLRSCPAEPEVEAAPARSPYGFSAPRRTGRHLDLVA